MLPFVVRGFKHSSNCASAKFYLNEWFDSLSLVGSLFCDSIISYLPQAVEVSAETVVLQPEAPQAAKCYLGIT